MDTLTLTEEFQFHNGAIKGQTYPLASFAARSCFNSTMVRLKVDPIGKAPSLLRGFNSTMVRLKAAKATVAEQKRVGFNSTMVRLKAMRAGRISVAPCRFNSTMVRLKVRDYDTTVVRSCKFQFHNGAIKGHWVIGSLGR